MDPGPLSEITGGSIEEDLAISDTDDSATNEGPCKAREKEDETRSNNEKEGLNQVRCTERTYLFRNRLQHKGSSINCRRYYR
jgi:hypothetical protein